MRYASITERLAELGGEKWLLYSQARQMAEDGHDIIEMTIGEPDVPTPPNWYQWPVKQWRMVEPNIQMVTVSLRSCGHFQIDTLKVQGEIFLLIRYFVFQEHRLLFMLH